LKQFFGKSLVVSEKQLCAYFGDNNLAPSVGQMVLEDKTIVPCWWKHPDQLIQHQINYIFKQEDLDGISSVDIVTGDDHGGGQFQMLLKLLLQFGEKPTMKRLFDTANVERSKDDINVIKETVLNQIVVGLQVIKNGSRFVVRLEENGQMSLCFSNINNEGTICDVPIYLFINGDVKYFAQMLGRKGMSTSWCMYCQIHPSG
jgi:hypothetical protein